MQVGKLGHPYTHHGGPMQQDHGSMNVCILSNSHPRQKWIKKKAFDWMKKKEKLKWDEFQAQVQQMPQVK